MANIRVDLDYTISDGCAVAFRSPCDCTEITGLIVYYRDEVGGIVSKEFALADAHGENVGDIPHLFAADVVVKVILDITSGMAFVQNADTNAYLEGRFEELEAQISEEIAKKEQLKPEFANSIDECTDTTKLYVLPDGYIYAYMLKPVYPGVTITEKSPGYWYNNNGVATFYDGNAGTCCKETAYIPVTEGDTLQITSRASEYNHVASGQWYDADKNPVTIITITTSDDNETIDVIAPTSAKYVRFFSMNYGTDASAVRLEVKWISCAAASQKGWHNTGRAFVPADYEDTIHDHEERIADLESAAGVALRGRKIVYDGDSICSSWGASNGGSYPQLIADATGCSFDNQGVGGGRFTTAVGADYNFHSIVDNLPNLPPDGDLYCFEGGVNDHWHHVPLGNFSESDYTGELDKTTLSGALETVFRYAITNFVGKPICLIIVHKCLYSAFMENDNGDTFSDYRNRMIAICEKYSIPYYDAYAKSGLNVWSAEHLANFFLVDENTGTGDGCHPNREGYIRYYVPQLVALFESLLPVTGSGGHGTPKGYGLITYDDNTITVS